MTCQECEQLLADAALTPAAEAHLRDCPECRALAAELAANSEALESMRYDPTPSQVRARPQRIWIWAAAAVVVLPPD